MSLFVCPECETRSDAELCPKCGTRTLKVKQEVQDPMIGRVLDGRYKIESLIGRGGMGAVYKAVQTSMKKIVAVKLIRMENADEGEAVKRFHREVKAASLLSHPHSIKVFDFGQSEDGNLYMVMEFLDGKPLGKALKASGTFTPARALKIVADVAGSLAEAHSVGLVHRDLKPDNVMLLNIFGDQDFVKVLDFGIAKFMESNEAAVTRAGVAVGTPHYMAPEQARGRQTVGPSADIYALGVMLFELLSGHKPFDAESPVEVLFMHVQNPIPELPDDCPASDALRDLVRRMMAKSPEARPTAEELIATANALRPGEAGFGEQTAVAVAPVRRSTGTQPARPVVVEEAAPKKSHKGLVMGLVVVGVALALLGGAYWMFGRGGAVEPPLPPLATALKMRLDSRPPGATVKDGATELGKTPFVHEFEPGTTRRALLFRLEGHADLTQDIEIQADGVYLAQLKPLPLKMKLDSEPQGALVKDGRRELGKTPLSHEFEPGTTQRTLQFVLDNYEDLTRVVDIKADGTFVAKLGKKTLKMRLESVPPGAQVKDGDKDLGTTPLDVAFEPDPATRTLLFQLDGYQDLTGDVAIKADGTFVAKLKRKRKAGSGGGSGNTGGNTGGGIQRWD